MNKVVIKVLKQNGCNEIPLEEYLESTKENKEKFMEVSRLKPGEFGYEEGKVEYQDESGCGMSVDKLVYCTPYSGVIAFEAMPGKLYAEHVIKFTNIETSKEHLAYAKIYEGGTKYMIPCEDVIVVAELIEEETPEHEKYEFE